MTDEDRDRLPSSSVAINCVDGRVQLPVLEWMRRNLASELVHNVTEPGPDGSLARGDGARRIEPIVRMLAGQGAIEAVAVVSHHDCRGNPVDEATHRELLERAVEEVSGWRLADRVLGLWVDRNREVAVACEARG